MSAEMTDYVGVFCTKRIVYSDNTTYTSAVSEHFPTNFAKKIRSPLCILRSMFKKMRWRNIFLRNSKENVVLHCVLDAYL
jgi:hypothetical protein